MSSSDFIGQLGCGMDGEGRTFLLPEGWASDPIITLSYGAGMGLMFSLFSVNGAFKGNFVCSNPPYIMVELTTALDQKKARYVMVWLDSHYGPHNQDGERIKMLKLPDAVFDMDTQEQWETSKQIWQTWRDGGGYFRDASPSLKAEYGGQLDKVGWKGVFW